MFCFSPAHLFRNDSHTASLQEQQPPDWPTGVRVVHKSKQAETRVDLAPLTNIAEPETEKMLSILRKARLKDKELRILMLCVTRFSFQTQD